MIHRTIYCRSRNPGSLLIRIGDGMGQWSHCAGIMADGEHVIESTALGGGVHYTPLEDVIRRSSEYLVIERHVPDKAAGDAWALGTIGLPYDWLGAAGVPLGRRWEDPGRWFCSEHNEMWQQKAGLYRFVRDPQRGVGPNISFRVA